MNNYNSCTGRFISEDPIGFAGGDNNIYRYVGNNPIMNVDPTGLITPGIFQSLNMNAPGASQQLGQELSAAVEVTGTVVGGAVLASGVVLGSVATVGFVATQGPAIVLAATINTNATLIGVGQSIASNPTVASNITQILQGASAGFLGGATNSTTGLPSDSIPSAFGSLVGGAVGGMCSGN